MNSLAFDTHKAVKVLTQAGAEESLAEALVATVGTVLGEHAATKDDIAELKRDTADLRGELKGDIAELKRDIADLRGELKGDIADLRGELKGDIADLRGELKGDITELKRDMESMELRLTIRLGAAIAIGVGALAALMTLFQFGLN